MTVNIVNLVGRAGAKPEIIHFPSGSMLCKLPLAVDRRSKNSDKPDWFELEMWGQTAKVAGDWVHKGKLLAVQGSLKIDTWSDRTTGAKRSKPVIKVDRLELLGSKRDSDADSVSNYDEEDNF